MIVILNDNEMFIVFNVGVVYSILGWLCMVGKYNWVKDEFEVLLKKVFVVGGKFVVMVECVKDGLKYMVVLGMFFEDFGFMYLGLVDGYSYDDLLEML